MPLPHIADIHANKWIEHTRFKGIQLKNLLTAAHNPLANVNVVQIPPGGVIGRHQHSKQVETVYVILGEAILTLEETEIPIRDGQVVAIPIALEHALRNDSATIVQVLTFFTPPLR